MTKNAKIKQKWRTSKRWKEFRSYAKSFYKGIDIVTGSKLYKGWQLHHLDMSMANYTNTDNIRDYATVNRETHTALHWAYRMYHKDHSFLDRFNEMIKEMEAINNDNGIVDKQVD